MQSKDNPFCFGKMALKELSFILSTFVLSTFNLVGGDGLAPAMQQLDAHPTNGSGREMHDTDAHDS